eukprot:4054406-Alexandrium_andersonii.AAC.1
MSASLVGSEMCIRDSARVALFHAWGPQVEGVALLVHVGYPQSELRGDCSCLLYTSDAADDM